MNDLRDLLTTAASVEPDVSPTERSATVVRRGRAARVRDRALVAGGGVLVLLAALVVPFALGGDDGAPDVAAPEPTPAITAAACPAQPIDVARTTGSVDLDEVVAVRACPAVGQEGEPLPSQAVLGVMAAAFAEDVAALPEYQLPDTCAAMSIAPQPWALQVETAGGERSVIGATMRLCASVSADGVERGADAVLAAFLGNQARQESGIPELACPHPIEQRDLDLAEGAPTWNASFEPAEATAGVVCYRADPMGESDYGRTMRGISAPLSPHVWDHLTPVVEDLAANRTPTGDGGMCTDTGPEWLIVLEDADGDQGAWVNDRCTGEYAGPGGYWTPGPEAAQAIDDALRGR